jgi:hypothetical protein
MKGWLRNGACKRQDSREPMTMLRLMNLTQLLVAFGTLFARDSRFADITARLGEFLTVTKRRETRVARAAHNFPPAPRSQEELRQRQFITARSRFLIIISVISAEDAPAIRRVELFSFSLRFSIKTK